MTSGRRVIVFRHGKQEDMGRGYSCWSPDASLSLEGVQQMRQVAEKYRQILMECVVFACSPLIRAQQSLHTMMIRLGYKGMPGLMDKIHLLSGLKYSNPEVWISDNASDTVSDMWRKNPKAIEREGKHVFQRIEKIADALEDGQSALCISHSGPLDAAVAFAREYSMGGPFFSHIKDLQKGEGVVFVFDEHKEEFFVGIEELRNG